MARGTTESILVPDDLAADKFREFEKCALFFVLFRSWPFANVVIEKFTRRTFCQMQEGMLDLM